jgi:hypothetical protein
MPTYEEGILARHSTPGLRKRELDRIAKKDHLGSLGIKGEDAAKILDQMYPEAVTKGPETCQS